MKDGAEILRKSVHLKRIGFGVAVIWTVAVVLIFYWHLKDLQEFTRQSAFIQAAGTLDSEASFRLWASHHGGIYLPVSGDVKPDPNLSWLENRDVTTESGLELTLVSPTAMTRLANKLDSGNECVRSRITSLSARYPENKPDPWETSVLNAFQDGRTEVSEISEINGQDYLRLMRPVMADESCLKCHEAQGYKAGALIGGVSFSVPMEPFYAGMRHHRDTGLIGFLAIWLTVLGGVSLSIFHIGKRIREREETTGKLEESEERFRALFENAPMGYHSLNDEGKLLAVNETWCGILGYSKEQAVGRGFSEFVSRSSQEQFRKSFLEFKSCGFLPDSELELVRKDGAEITVSIKGKVRRSEDGSFIQTHCVIQDITERKLAEERSARFNRILEGSLNEIYIFDPETLKFVEVNRGARENIGYSMEELRDMTPVDIKPGISGEAFELKIEPLRSGRKEKIKFETNHQRKNGSQYPVEVHLQLIGDGKPLFVAVILDITERTRAEAILEKRIVTLTRPRNETGGIVFDDLFNLQDIQRLQDEFAGATGVASIITNIDGTPITKPSNFRRICSEIIRKTEKGLANCHKSDAVLGRMNLSGPIVQPCLSCGLWDAGAAISIGGRHIANWLIGQVRDKTQSEEKMREYAREIGVDEEDLIQAFREVPSMSRQQFERIAQVLHTLASQISTAAYQNVQQARFITERKKAEEEKAQLEEQYHHAQKVESIGRLAGGVAHDLNNLLSPILGYGEILKEELEDETSRGYTDEILRAGGRARDLVRQLLAFSRKQTLDYKSVDINETITGFENLLRRTIREDINLEIVPSSKSCRVKADVGQIEQVILNLAVNAQDAMPEGGRLIIETAITKLNAKYAEQHPEVRPGTFVMLSVSDNGCGMDSEVLGNLFEPFFSTKGEQGTGLGLATVYGIVMQHDGSISVSSTLGEGTVFRIYLPVSNEARDKLNSAEKKSPNLKGSETVLLVEDNQQVRNLVRSLLKRHGYTVHTAENGIEGLKVMETCKASVNLLLTDVVMPELNGRELFARASEMCPGLKVLYMSGYTDAVIDEGEFPDGDIPFIQKPFTTRALADKVKSILAGR